MTEKIQRMLSQLRAKEYRKLRRPGREDPLLLPEGYEEVFGFHYGASEKTFKIWGNITPNYARVIGSGIDSVCEEIRTSIANTADEEKKAFGMEMLKAMEKWYPICQKQQRLAQERGLTQLSEALKKVPFKPAETFYEACLFLAICIFFLRRSPAHHLGLGRFDQYMYPYFKHDLENGVSKEELFETVEAFFLTLNYDTDRYIGVQQGDNGQSMVLGGFDGEGNSQYNELSQMCMQASLELNVTDPKINLRVGKNTPIELYEFATLLTKQGLGFPQYCNDDIVVPGLMKLGYDREDALNYVVAACWEYIIPNCGAEIPNIGVMNFPLVVSNAVRQNLASCKTFEELLTCAENAIAAECDRLIELKKNQRLIRLQPMLSVFVDGCIETLTNLWQGAKYRAYGCHGAGIANAADALAAVKKTVYDEKSVTAEELLSALEADFEGYEELRNRLKDCPKMGNNDDYVDDIASFLMSSFSRHLNNRPNGIGGIWRAGTGSAMEYLNSARVCPATADGRKACEPYSSSFSPSLDVKTTGILSVLQSFTKHDMTEIINGGPLTLEVHDTVLRNEIGIKKTAQLVKAFVDLGGHQLQLNSINRERLLDAQAHPENHADLIVRVWGWSGYFNELDKKYQNHIIRRTEYLQ